MQNELEMCPKYTDAPAVGYLTIKLQNSIWYKCLNLSNKITYVRTHIHTDGCIFVHMYPHTENGKTICPWHHPMRGHKNENLPIPSQILTLEKMKILVYHSVRIRLLFSYFSNNKPNYHGYSYVLYFIALDKTNFFQSKHIDNFFISP